MEDAISPAKTDDTLMAITVAGKTGAGKTALLTWLQSLLKEQGIGIRSGSAADHYLSISVPAGFFEGKAEYQAEPERPLAIGNLVRLKGHYKRMVVSDEHPTGADDDVVECTWIGEDGAVQIQAFDTAILERASAD